MYLSWYGLSCFKISAKTLKGESIIITDPFTPVKTGFGLPRGEAHIIAVSHPKSEYHNNTSIFTKNHSETFIINSAGEYEIRDIFIIGFAASDHSAQLNSPNFTQATAFVFNLEGIRLAHLGWWNNKTLNENQLENLQNVHILTLPVGGGEVTEAKTAAAIVAQVEPKIVIPIYFHLPKLKIKLNPLDLFLKELSGTPKSSVKKLKITNKDINQESLRIIIMEP